MWLVLCTPFCHIIGARSHGYPSTGVRFKLFVNGYHMIYTSIAHALAAFFSKVSHNNNNNSFQQFWKVLHNYVFAQKNFPKDIFNCKICYRYDQFSTWTLCRTIQEVIVLVILNQPVLCTRLILKLLMQFLPEMFSTWSNYLALINRAGGLYGRILTEVVSTDRTQWGLYTRPRSRLSHTDRLSSVNKMFIIWQKQE